MIDITSIHINYRRPTKDGKGKMFVKKIRPSDSTNELAIKHDTALAVSNLPSDAIYYYVVIEIDRGGTKAYRTVTKKIVL